jgi:hypothetical protein
MLGLQSIKSITPEADETILKDMPAATQANTTLIETPTESTTKISRKKEMQSSSKSNAKHTRASPETALTPVMPNRHGSLTPQFSASAQKRLKIDKFLDEAETNLQQGSLVMELFMMQMAEDHVIRQAELAQREAEREVERQENKARREEQQQEDMRRREEEHLRREEERKDERERRGEERQERAQEHEQQMQMFLMMFGHRSNNTQK